MVLLFVVCGLWLAGEGPGVFLRTYLVHYIRFFLYQGYDIRFYREADCIFHGTTKF